MGGWEGAKPWELSGLKFYNQRKSGEGEKTTLFLIPGCILHAKLLQSCLTLFDPMDCSPLGSSVPGILQARILEWVAMPSSRVSSQPKDQTCITMSAILAVGFFINSATWEARHRISITFLSCQVREVLCSPRGLSWHYGGIISGLCTIRVFHFEISPLHKFLFFMCSESMS